jgi:Methylamine utilisation protein MauE
MPYLVIGARAMLFVIFVASFTSKMRSRTAFAAFADSLAGFGIRSTRLQAGTAGIVISAEAAAAFLVALPFTVTWGLAAGGLIITAFTAQASIARRQGLRPVCKCFGSATSAFGATHIMRNGLIIAVAIAGLLAEAAGGRTHLAAAPVVLATGVAVLAGAGVVVWDDLAALLAPLQGSGP